MHKSILFKYQIGLLVIGVFTVGLTIFVLVQANSKKQDTKTYEAANQIADKLNNYITIKQEIPDNLSTAGVSDVPSTITYQKSSDKEYKFCVTYKTDSGSVDAGAVFSSALSGYYGGGSFESSEPQTYLYISSQHKKGENCQTVEPNIYNFDNFDLNNYYNNYDYNFRSN